MQIVYSFSFIAYHFEPHAIETKRFMWTINLTKHTFKRKADSLYLSTFSLFMFNTHLYFSFNTLVMPQWIKIQSLFKINTTETSSKYLSALQRVSKATAPHKFVHWELLCSKRPKELRPNSSHEHVPKSLTITLPVERPKTRKRALRE